MVRSLLNLPAYCDGQDRHLVPARLGLVHAALRLELVVSRWRGGVAAPPHLTMVVAHRVEEVLPAEGPAADLVDDLVKTLRDVEVLALAP